MGSSIGKSIKLNIRLFGPGIFRGRLLYMAYELKIRYFIKLSFVTLIKKSTDGSNYWNLSMQKKN